MVRIGKGVLFISPIDGEGNVDLLVIDGRGVIPGVVGRIVVAPMGVVSLLKSERPQLVRAQDYLEFEFRAVGTPAL